MTAAAAIERNNPLRHEIASGRPVLVWTSGASVAAVVEAARVAGRLGDLRVAHADPRPGLDRVEAWTRAVPEAARLRRPGGRDPYAYLDVPPLETDAMPWDRAIVVLGVSQRPGMLDWITGYGEEMARRVADAGGGPLAMFGDEEHSRMAGRRERRPGEDGPSAPFELPGTDRRMVLYGSVEAVARAWSGGPEAWADAWGRYRRTLRVHRGDTLSGLMSEDRLVMAATATRYARDDDEPVRGMTVFEVDAKGWLSVVWAVVPEASRELLDERAMAVWTGGIGAGLSWRWRDPDGGRHTPMPQGGMAAVAALYGGDPRVPDPGHAPTLRAILGSRIDVPLLKAIGRAEHPEAVLSRIQADPTLRSRRRDFCLTWPAFSDLMLDARILAGTDDGLPTMPLIAEATGMTPATLRRFVGRAPMPAFARSLLPGPEFGPGAVHRYAHADLFAAFGHDRIPPRGDKAGWTGFLRCAKAVTAIYRRGGVVARRVPAAEVAALMLGGPRGSDWASRGAAVGSPGTMRDLADLGDVVPSLARWLDEIGHGVEDRSLAFRILARHGSIPRLAEASRRWHDTPALADGAHRLPRGAGWPVPFDPVDLGDGWTARVVATVQGLVDEGGHGADADGIMGLRHCVGSYAAKAFTGESLIVSMRRTTAEGTVRFSTAELRPSDEGDWSIGGRPYVLVQHRAVRNARPGPEATSRLHGLRTLLAAGEVPIRTEALDPRELRGRASAPDRAGTLHAAWRPILPESLREASLQDLLGLVRRLDEGVRLYEDPFEREELAIARRFR